MRARVEKLDVLGWNKPNTKGKGDIMADGCADTSVADILNCFVEVPWNELKVTLVRFDDDLSKKSIPIGAAASAIEVAVTDAPVAACAGYYSIGNHIIHGVAVTATTTSA